MSSPEIIITVIIFAILIVSIVNVLTLFQMKKTSKDKTSSDIPQERYFELKYRIQTFITIASIVIIVTGLLGVKTYSDLKTEISAPLNDTINNLRSRVEIINNDIGDYINKIDYYDSVFNKYTADLEATNKSKEDVTKNIEHLTSQVGELDANISGITNFSSLKNIYIVDSVFIDLQQRTRKGIKKRYFSQLQTIDGKSLPKFNTPPIILNNVSTYGNIIRFYNVTNEYFEFELEEGIGGAPIEKLQVWIVEGIE